MAAASAEALCRWASAPDTDKRLCQGVAVAFSHKCLQGRSEFSLSGMESILMTV